MDNRLIPKGQIDSSKGDNFIPQYGGRFSNPSKRDLSNPKKGGEANPSIGCLSNPSKGGGDTPSKEAILNPSKEGNPKTSMGFISEIGTVVTFLNGIL